MRLTDELNKQRQQFLASAPADVVELMGSTTQQLQTTGIERSALQVGEKAPSITVIDTDSKTVELYSVLQEGPVILKFFRGHW